MSWTNAVILMMWTLAADPLYSNTKGQPTRTPDQEQPVVFLRGPVHQTFAALINLPGLTVDAIDMHLIERKQR